MRFILFKVNFSKKAHLSAKDKLRINKLKNYVNIFLENLESHLVLLQNRDFSKTLSYYRYYKYESRVEIFIMEPRPSWRQQTPKRLSKAEFLE